MSPAALTVAVCAACAVLTWPGRVAPRPVTAPSAPAAEPPPENVMSVAAALDLLALALGAGVPVVSAVEAVAARSGPVVRSHLRQVVAALRWGVDEQAAWRGLPVVWGAAGRALTLAGMAGVPPSALIRRAAADLRRDEAARLEAASARLGVHIVLPLGLCFLPAFALLTVVPVISSLATGIIGGMT